MVKCAIGVMDIPIRFQDMSEWVMRFPVKDRSVISAGVAAVFWVIWKTGNVAVFIMYTRVIQLRWCTT